MTGKYPLQQENDFDQILKRRAHDLPVSTVSIGKRMKTQCEKDNPVGYVSNKDKFKY